MLSWTHTTCSFPWITPGTKRQNIWSCFINSFFCKRPFSQYIWSSFIYSFFSAQPFDQNIWPSFVYSFFPTRLFNQNIWSSFIYFFFSEWSFDQKLSSSLIFLLFGNNHLTKICGPLTFSLFFCTRPFDKELGSSWIYFFYLYTTIRPKFVVLLHLAFLLHTAIWQRIRILINLFLLFVRNHSTKILSHHYS